MAGAIDLTRPYLVVPKLIEQPTWGGTYIVTSKGWDKHKNFGSLLIGQSYELFSGSNLSLLNSSADAKFMGELTDNTAVAHPTAPAHTIPLAALIEASPDETLGREVTTVRGPHIQLLIKYTQALGNSFQVHIKDGVKFNRWEPKPESWYYFEPGLVTLGVKPGISWNAYHQAVTAISEGATSLSRHVKVGTITYDQGHAELQKLIAKHDPWQFVNTVPVKAGQLVDMSSGGIHHSWEEDPHRAPLGNVLYEIQHEALDTVSTFRNFDKGKMEPDGSLRPLQIDEYFDAIDHSPAANDPGNHLRNPEPRAVTASFRLDALLNSRHYSLDKLTLAGPGASFSESLSRFKHFFVKSGQVKITAGGHAVTVTSAHSCFIPAAAGKYTIKNLADHSEILISY